MTVQITDHADRGIDRLPSQFRDKPKLEALLRVLLGQVQDVEDALWQLFTQRALAGATGVTLDAIGKLVGQPRNALSDADYRRYISARIATNRSKGKISDLYKIARLIINDLDAALYLDNQGNAAAVMKVTGIVLDDDLAAILIEFLQDAAKAGVRIILESQTDIEDESFTLAISAFLDGALVGGETTILVDSTDGFPSSGSLDIDVGLADEETVTYAGITSTSFIGVSAVANPHPDASCIQLSGAPGKGLGDEADPLVGGTLASAIEAVA
jgi:hypothetical protein